MSRKSQDIPIRPRYGIPDLGNDENYSEAERISYKTRKTSSSAMEPSSYSEIPFLAQYPEMQDTTASEKIERHCSVGEPDVEDEEDNDSNSFEENKTPRRPNSLHCDSSFPYELEGATSTDGQMRHFVAENLEEKIRSDQLSYASHNSTPSVPNKSSNLLTRRFLQTQRPQIDANVLNDIEIEAQYLAASIDNLMENLCNLLHSISSITADNVEVHKNAVNKLTDSMDANIKCMYTIMAKTEEITKSMKPTEQLGQRIREIKRLVDMLDGTM
ncbi:BLOC-1-related complex subunit 6 isoform X1 [Anastrepha obliqua]|uniref:BLOC-1-related complex subunit 6 isoform X1 n=1 Tax=Anastrepha obliqua TaxID=95512 RepID=UPI00240A0CC2|nr:BLOC-1-related complex subunit 6 isoform X1 [Anastrepha obliqua]